MLISVFWRPFGGQRLSWSSNTCTTSNTALLTSNHCQHPCYNTFKWQESVEKLERLLEALRQEWTSSAEWRYSTPAEVLAAPDS